MNVAGYFKAFVSYRDYAAHVPIDSSLCKPLCLLLAKLHGRELHCPINYYECFVFLKRVENLALNLILILRSENMRLPFEDFRRSTSCFILKVTCLIFTQLGRVLRNGIFYFSHNTFETFTVTTRHVVAMATCVFIVSITDIAQRKSSAVIRAAATILSAVVAICCLEIQLAFV